MNRTHRLVAVVGVQLLAAALVATSGAAARDPAAVGQWSHPIDIGLVGIHAAMLHTGKVLLFEHSSGKTGSRATVFDPETATKTDVPLPWSRDVFCAGLTIGPDGRVVVLGGMRPLALGHTDALGSPYLSFFDPQTLTWATGPPMAANRYYPTALEEPDGKTLVFTGSDTGFGIGTQKLMEVYDPATNDWIDLPHSADTDSALYSKAFVLPDGRIFRAGPQTQTALFDPATNRWKELGTLHGGDRPGGTAVLLPDGHTVLTAGGGFRATNTAETIDLSAPSPHWQLTGSMRRARSEFNLTLLPDGTALAIGGGRVGGFYKGPVYEAELYDPATGTWRLLAAQRAQRTYHSTAVLLPDGRVLSAGSDNGPMSTTVELYSPPYLFHGPRPAIATAPTAVTYGQAFTIATPDAAGIQRVALIRPGSVTHAADFDQRYLNLSFTAGSGLLHAAAPASPNLAPPGYYMLFLLNAEGVPSVAQFVHLG
jgi:hypothetical protein